MRRNDPFAALADNLTYYRQERRLSPGDLARRVGMRPEHITQIEEGRRKISLPALARLANALRVTTQQLI